MVLLITGTHHFPRPHLVDLRLVIAMAVTTTRRKQAACCVRCPTYPLPFFSCITFPPFAYFSCLYGLRVLPRASMSHRACFQHAHPSRNQQDSGPSLPYMNIFYALVFADESCNHPHGNP